MVLCCLNSPSTNVVLATKVIKLVHIYLWIVYVTLQIKMQNQSQLKTSEVTNLALY